MLYHGDCRKVMKALKSNSIDLVFADPPYFLSNGGPSIKSGKIVSVDKGEWDKAENYANIKEFTIEWLSECYRLLKNSGTIWVSGTHHNIFDIEAAMRIIGYKIINIIVWHKDDPPPLIYKTKFRFSHELIIWAKKGKTHFFDYDLMKNVNNEEMGDVWRLPAVQLSEKKYGYHPTQKPERLLRRIIGCASKKGEIILDPFLGSGTTCFVAKQLDRKYIGIEKEKEFFDLAKVRIESLQ